MCNNCYCTPLCHCAEYIQSRSVQISSDQLSSGISRPDWPWRRESPHPMPHPLLNADSLGLLDFRSTRFKFQMVSNRSWSWLVPAFALSFIRAQACIGLLTWSKDHPSSTLPQAPNRKSTGTASHLKIPCAFGQLQAADLKFFMQAEDIMAGIPTNISRYQTLSYPIIVRYHKLCAIAACYSYSLFVWAPRLPALMQAINC